MYLNVFPSPITCTLLYFQSIINSLKQNCFFARHFQELFPLSCNGNPAAPLPQWFHQYFPIFLSISTASTRERYWSFFYQYLFMCSKSIWTCGQFSKSIVFSVIQNIMADGFQTRVNICSNAGKWHQRFLKILKRTYLVQFDKHISVPTWPSFPSLQVNIVVDYNLTSYLCFQLFYS